ncbi:MAG: hypothetical protein IJY21_03155 [Clostridia bacterium]|nr:hypothetical protein [Clostridia bacterium]
MNYVKKMCILRQIKQGFSGDGKTLSGLVKIEQYGKNLAVEVSIINFAPLAAGEYYCLLSDGKGRTEMLSLRGKSMFNILSDIDITGGFCAIICYVKNDVVPIAYGINGNGSYDWRTILNATLPPVFPNNKGEFINKPTDTPKQTAADFIAAAPPKFEQNAQKGGGRVAMNDNSAPLAADNCSDENAVANHKTEYDDEKIVTENYYKERENEQDVLSKNSQNAHPESTMETNAPTGATPAENDDAESVLHPFKTDGDGYYLSVKAELDELFRTYPKDDTLSGAFSCSEWVRVKGTAKEPQYLVGVLYEDGWAKYICYALAAQDKDNPPDEIKNVCSFVPVSALSENIGFFVIFQSATGGECIKPTQL